MEYIVVAEYIDCSKRAIKCSSLEIALGESDELRYLEDVYDVIIYLSCLNL